VGNIDVSRRLNEQFNLAIGSEFRVEMYEIMAGDQASYTGEGAQSFPGTDPKNAVWANRSNFGGYIDLAYDITKEFLLDGTARLEQYSDFGNAFVWKLSSRYKLNEDKIVLRSSISTGFRAPSLQQINLQGIQTTFTNGNLESQGIFNNHSTEVKQLGVPKLKAEKSINFTAGVCFNPVPKLSISVDYYNILVKDRIILSSDIGAVSPATPASAGLNQVLTTHNITTLNFFVNGLDTRTQGLDFVASYRNIQIGAGKLGVNLSGNCTLENKALSIFNPPLIEAAGKTVFDQANAALVLTSRPKYKGILGFDYRIGKWGINLYNTMFGPTTFHDGGSGLDPNLNTEFKTKIVTDLGANVQLMKNVVFAANIQNLFNVLPKWNFVPLNAAGQAILDDPNQVRSQTNMLTFNGKYATTMYNGSHFCQLGTTFLASLTMRF
jgi:iron complex outermembrane receptor protein